ncbi:MAG: VanZ family protein [Myxococcales bacterium]
MSRASLERLGWLALAGYAAVIFYLSSESNPLPALTAHVWDKLLHLTEYGGLGLLFGLAVGRRGRIGWRDIVVWSAVLGLLYGASDEIHQSFVPGRDAEAGDVLADTLGALVGGALSLAPRWLRPS